MTANRWELVRTPQGWKIKRRTWTLERQLEGALRLGRRCAP